jgi:hypothetical protein
MTASPKAVLAVAVQAEIERRAHGLPLPPSPQLSMLDEDIEASARAAAVREGQPHKAGRPKGAMNVSSRKLREMILRQYRHPVLGPLEAAQRPLGDLVAYLRSLGSDVDPFEVLQFQTKCALEVLPYVAPKLGALTGDDNSSVVPVYASLTASPDGTVAVTMSTNPMQQNQGLSAPAPVVLEAESWKDTKGAINATA